MVRLDTVAVIGCLVACGPDKGPQDSGTARHSPTSIDIDYTTEVLTSNGSWRVSYTTAPSPIPLSDPFDVTFMITSHPSGDPLIGATVDANGWMPNHGHGMTVAPLTVDNGDGRYSVSGMLFHMEGLWDITADVTSGEVTEGAIFHVACCD